MDRYQLLLLRAGVLIGVGGGIALGCGLMLLVNSGILGQAVGRMMERSPFEVLALPCVLCVVAGALLLKKAVAS